jgi:hypothetical protein
MAHPDDWLARVTDEQYGSGARAVITEAFIASGQ